MILNSKLFLYKQVLLQNVALGKFFEELVRKDERFEIPAKRYLGLIVLRLKGANTRTEMLLKNLNREGKVHMVPASLKGIYVIRYFFSI